MTQRHIHADTIIAWANGAEIEYFCERTKVWYPTKDKPLVWYTDRQYRVKPKEYTVVFTEDELRVILCLMNTTGDEASKILGRGAEDGWVKPLKDFDKDPALALWNSKAREIKDLLGIKD